MGKRGDKADKSATKQKATKGELNDLSNGKQKRSKSDSNTSQVNKIRVEETNPRSKTRRGGNEQLESMEIVDKQGISEEINKPDSSKVSRAKRKQQTVTATTFENDETIEMSVGQHDEFLSEDEEGGLASALDEEGSKREEKEDGECEEIENDISEVNENSSSSENESEEEMEVSFSANHN